MGKTIRVEYLVFLFSVFLMAGYNQNLWQGIIVTHSDISVHNLLFLTSCGVFLTALFNLIFNVFAVKGIVKPILIIIVISSASASFFMDSYGVVIDSSMLQNVVETDSSEAMDLLSFAFISHMILWGLLPAGIIYKLNITFSHFSRQATINVFSMLMSILAVGLIAAMFYQDYASTFRNHREFRYLINPTNYIHAIDKTVRSQFAQKEKTLTSITKQVKLGTIATNKSNRTITVFVLGETARAQEFHLDGYQR